MKLIDLIMYINYNFASKTLKRQKENAKWTAFLLTSLYFAMMLIGLICVLGIFWNNELSTFFKEGGTPYWFILYIVSPCLLTFRYYLNKDKLDRIVYKFSSDPIKNKLVNKLKYVIMMIIPTLFFCLFRLYVVGKIKWW